MHPILFSFGKINFYSYGLFVAISFFAALLVFYKLTKKNRLWQKDTFERTVGIFILILVFARLTYFITYYNYYTHWWEIFYVWQGGLVSYGGIFGLVFGIWIFLRSDFLRYLDFAGIATLFGGIFWRVGGILAGSYPTMSSESFFAIKGSFPAVELEIVFIFFGSLMLYYLCNKKIFQSGRIFFLALFYYGFLRLFLDNWRDLSPTSIGLNSGQLLGLLLAIISIFALAILVIKSKNSKVVNKQIHL